MLAHHLYQAGDGGAKLSWRARLTNPRPSPTAKLADLGLSDLLVGVGSCLRAGTSAQEPWPSWRINSPPRRVVVPSSAARGLPGRQRLPIVSPGRTPHKGPPVRMLSLSTGRRSSAPGRVPPKGPPTRLAIALQREEECRD